MHTVRSKCIQATQDFQLRRNASHGAVKLPHCVIGYTDIQWSKIMFDYCSVNTSGYELSQNHEKCLFLLVRAPVTVFCGQICLQSSCTVKLDFNNIVHWILEQYSDTLL